MSEWAVGPQVRRDVLVRLAEQAMRDPEFRALARDDLQGALKSYGYELNEDEWLLVSRFRQTLEDADIDLSLGRQRLPADLAALFG